MLQEAKTLKFKRKKLYQYRIITKNIYPFYEVAFSNNLIDFKENEWNYIVNELKLLIPKHLDVKGRTKWLLAHITTLALSEDFDDNTTDDDTNYDESNYDDLNLSSSSSSYNTSSNNNNLSLQTFELKGWILFISISIAEIIFPVLLRDTSFPSFCFSIIVGILLNYVLIIRGDPFSLSLSIHPIKNDLINTTTTKSIKKVSFNLNKEDYHDHEKKKNQI